MPQNNYIENVRGFLGLFSPTNKDKQVQEDHEDDIGELMPEFELDMTDEEILAATKTVEDEYYQYEQDIEKRQKENQNYWRGKQFGYMAITQGNRPMMDNVLFEAVETFLPIATRNDPEPLVVGDNSDNGNAIADSVKNVLAFQAKKQRLRKILKKTTRFWILDFLGAVQVSWDVRKNDIKTEPVRVKDLIFDPEAHIDENCEYTGAILGIRKSDTARDLMEMFPKKAAEIARKVGKKNLATKITYKQWWTQGKSANLYFTFDQIVLGKYRSPHWNYDGVEKATDPETGEVTETEVQGRNHFPFPKIPVLFLSIISTSEHPHDDTGLIEQNLPNQDLLNKRNKQIDKNVSLHNNGVVVSGDYYTKEQAAEATEQMSRGNGLWQPTGEAGKGATWMEAPNLPADVFNDRDNQREELRNIFGISGSTPQGVDNEDTARGKILVTQLDASRIGGGVTDFIEDLAGGIYNWWTQMFYVYYTEQHTAAVLGGDKTEEFYQLKNTDLNLQLIVDVKEGSLVPKDPLTQRNEAMDLWSANAIDPISFFSRLDDPNPLERAEQLLKWQMIQKGQLPPQVLFPDWNVGMQNGELAAPGQTPAPGVQNLGQQQPAQTPTPEAQESKQLMQEVPVNK